jgi:hypothetical protein
MTREELQAKLDELDDGVLRSGAHPAGGREFCALEFESQVRGREWSDAPITLPDLRPINDGPWSSDRARTDALLPVMAALWDWSTWDDARRVRWASIVALETVRQIIAELPGLPDEVRVSCRAASDLPSAARASARVLAEAAEAARAAGAADAAARAAWAAAGAAARAARAAWAAAGAAAWAARASAEAAEAAKDAILTRACRIWIDAVAASEAQS